MSNEGDALIRELEEEVRREKLAKLWNQYGIYIVGAIAVVLVGIGGGQLWLQQQRAAAEQAGASFMKAAALANDGKSDDAHKALEAIAKNGPKSYAHLAELRLAGAAVQAGKSDDAIKIFEKISADGATDTMLRDYALLQLAALKLGTPGWTSVANRINDLTKASSPWRYTAREIKGLAAYKAGELDAAREALEPLVTDPAAPQSIRARAEMVMGLLTAKQMAGPVVPANPSPTAGTSVTEPAAKPK